MKSVALIVVSSAIFLFTGCATRDYVKQQMEPLVERMSKIEAKQKECCEAAERAAKKCEKTFELEQHKYTLDFFLVLRSLRKVVSGKEVQE